jgi:hypothetical protein
LKKLLSISLVFAYLTANTELRQILSLPHLIGHYHAHQQANPSLSFLNFLAMHYGGDDGNPNDNNEDSKLPFKNPHALNVAFSALPAPVNSGPTAVSAIPCTRIFIYEAGYIPTVHLDALLRPPIAVS